VGVLKTIKSSSQLSHNEDDKEQKKRKEKRTNVQVLRVTGRASQFKLALIISNLRGERACFPSDGLIHPGGPDIIGLRRRNRGVVGVLGDRFNDRNGADDSGGGYEESSEESGERRGHHFRIGGRKNEGKSVGGAGEGGSGETVASLKGARRKI